MSFQEASLSFDSKEKNKEFPAADIPIFSISPTFPIEKIQWFVDRYASLLKKTPAVFIKREGDGLLSKEQMQKMSTRILFYNSTIRIMTDQEWGKVRRYKDFDVNISNPKNKYLQNEWYKKRKNCLTPQISRMVETLFTWKEPEIFPSLKEVWDMYRKLSDPWQKKAYLDYISYLRLLTIKNAGLNTYGFVCDLDRGNPAISGLWRSFSSSANEYLEFATSLLRNAEELGMGIYLKHFPGHGIGVDTHKQILQFENSEKHSNYLKENMELFVRLLRLWKVLGVEMWLMVGHMIIPKKSVDWKKDFLDWFTDCVSKADYIITDDLFMQWHKSVDSSSFRQDYFYTTELVLNKSKNIMKLNLWTNQHLAR